MYMGKKIVNKTSLFTIILTLGSYLNRGFIKTLHSIENFYVHPCCRLSDSLRNSSLW